MQEQNREPMGLWMSIRLAWSLGHIIAIPAVVFGFGGAYLDKYLNTSPAFLLSGFVLAALLSAFGVVRKVREIFQAS